MRQIGFSSSPRATFTVHRAIQGLIWGRMIPFGKDRLVRLSKHSVLFQYGGPGESKLWFYIEPDDIKLLGV